MAKRTGYQLGVQLYTLRDHIQTPKELAKTLERVRKIGYRLVQISGIEEMEPAEVKKALDGSGLAAVGHHCSLADLRGRMKELIAALHLWNCPYTALAYLGEEERKDGKAWKARAKEMNAFGKTLAKEGITLQYHNHAFEFHKFQGHTGLEILYANTDPRYVQAEIDTYWVAAGGGDPVQWIGQMKKRMDQVHFKDGVMLENHFAICEVGSGNLNWPAIVKACRAIGVKHYLVEQDTCPVTQDPFKSLAMSYKFLTGLGLK